MSKLQKLGANTLIFAIGNIGSKLMIFLLVPFYTVFLSPAQLGKADMSVTTVSLLVPLLTLSISDAVMRFGLDEKDSENVLAVAMTILSLEFIILLVATPFLFQISFLKEEIIYLVVLLFFQSLYLTLQQYARAVGKIKLFAWSSLIVSLILTVSMIIVLGVFRLGVVGFIFAQASSFLVGSFFLCWQMKIKVPLKKLDTVLLKRMLLYSVPLMPNALTWWVIQLSDRYFITLFSGIAAAGLYVVAVKIPSLINLCSSIFFQAWQLSVIENKEGNGNYIRLAFSIFSMVLMVGISLLMIANKLLVSLLFSTSYSTVWQFIPFLLLSSLFSALATFLATNDMKEMKTTFIFQSTMIGAGLNIVLNLILIPVLGLQGASISGMLSFAMTFYIRGKRQNMFENQFFKRSFICSIILLIGQASSISFCKGVSFWYQLIFLVGIVGINAPIMARIAKEIKNKIKRKEMSI
ncbi:oligosaccharide flippase family protein [Carnobacterium maltaromaticum]|uniref:Oligosaccharide flippase family protein n=1 Tax=Carnobacterium maltaromaticum TaxID=2751 RepID=A0AAW9K776_CARML|nr:oligosaccharide flippase family protein [Carnobacterium maltaromaticum]MDZ5759257.1 oligosaccharide flippase family protein [Carnobacterium maltaromaticum]